MSSTINDGAGAFWFENNVHAQADYWPLATSTLGAPATSASTSKLFGAREVLVYGLMITSAGTDVSIIVGSTTPTVLTGMTFSAVTLYQRWDFPNPISVKFSNDDDANVGIRQTGNAHAVLYFKKLA